MPSSVAGAVAGQVASRAIGKVMGGGGGGGGGGGSGGGGAPGLLPFSAGGIALRFNAKKGGMPEIISSPDEPRQILVNQLAQSYLNNAQATRDTIPGINSVFGEGISGIQSAMDKVNPGYGALTDARVGAIRNAGTAADSDLKANLARRRVLGSSFGYDDISRQKAEFGVKEAEARAKSFLEELDATTKLIDKKFNYQTSQIDAVNSAVNQAFSFDRASDQTRLDELNAQLQVMTSLIGGMQKIAQQNAEVEAKYAAEGAKSRGQFAAGIGNQIGGYVQQGLGSIFGGGETWANGDSFR